MAFIGQMETALTLQTLSVKTSALSSSPIEKLSGHTPTQDPQPMQRSLFIFKDMFKLFYLLNPAVYYLNNNPITVPN